MYFTFTLIFVLCSFHCFIHFLIAPFYMALYFILCSFYPFNHSLADPIQLHFVPHGFTLCGVGCFSNSTKYRYMHPYFCLTHLSLYWLLRCCLIVLFEQIFLETSLYLIIVNLSAVWPKYRKKIVPLLIITNLLCISVRVPFVTICGLGLCVFVVLLILFGYISYF